MRAEAGLAKLTSRVEKLSDEVADMSHSLSGLRLQLVRGFLGFQEIVSGVEFQRAPAS